MKLNQLLFLAALFFISINAFSQSSNTIYFRSGGYTPPANIQPAFIDSFNSFPGKKFAIIQFDHTPTEADKKILSANRMELLDYIPNNAYTVLIASQVSYQVLVTTGVRSLFIPSARTKMDDFFSRGKIPAWAVKSYGTVDALISYPKTISFSELLSELKSRNIEVLSITRQAYRIISIRIGQDQLEEIASLPFIEYLQVAPPEDQPLNNNSRYGARATILNTSAANGGKGLKGEGVVMGIGDNADIQTHADFAGRLINRSPLNAAGHGHHVAGTAAGAGNIIDLYKGYAPKAIIIKQAMSGILENAATYVQDHGMVITNNSYGNSVECEYNGIYDLYSRQMDQMAFDLPFLTNVFAAGNSGHLTCAPFDSSYHTVLGGYQSAKNIISVGATNDSSVVAFFSSRGPVKDGRLKPDITAMGQQVLSTWPTNNHSYNNGTSMAAPAVSGGLALLYQRYRQLHAGANPKNGLVKAILLNGASDKGNAGPDYANGFGWMNLLRSVEMIENNSYFQGNATQSNVYDHTISVPANTARLKVMLYWNDPASALLTPKTLVNDLDLRVIRNTQNYFPAILDTSKAGSGNASTTGADHLNNNEQVIIDQPAAGNYTLRVSSTAINQNPSQEYFVVYDVVPVQLKLVSPMQGMALPPNERIKITWEAHGFATGTVNIDLSIDDGSSWTSIATAVDIHRPGYSWFPPVVATDKAKIRITKTGTGETSTTGAFTILPSTIAALAPVQCESYIHMTWNSIPGSTGYEVMQLTGDEMKTVATTTDTNYVFSGLDKDSTYYVAVRGMINGKEGPRSRALVRKPNAGTCTGNISDNDLVLDSILAPGSGRKFTSTDPGTSSVVSVRIKNLDDIAVNNFELKYSLNGGAWITETVNTPVAAGALYVHNFSVPVNISVPGNYQLAVVVKNLVADAVTKNDSAFQLVKIIANDPLDLTSAFIDNMETAVAAEYGKDTIGLAGLERYDYSRTTVYGRLRSFINSGIANSGSKALTLDIDRFVAAGNTNFLYGTFNLTNYNTTVSNVRLDFKYLNHGQATHASNRVWIRGGDTQPWIEVYNLFDNQLDPGQYKKTESIEISNLLQAASQNFSGSFQVRWGQFGTRAATDRLYAGGYSFDDVRLYTVVNDMQLKSIDAPLPADCNLGASNVIKITVRNSSNSTLTNIPVKYRINNGSWISETIPSVAANTSIQYSFSATADFSATGAYLLTALVDLGTDSFRENDTLSKEIRNLSLFSTYPYLQNFEQNDGQWYTGGIKSSWEYGTPASYKIKSAASGIKVWKTNLQGTYNSREKSYLYSPCFNISGMTSPTLSFSVALDIEDCGNTLCDAAWVEYSSDGITWTKLGSSGSGTNWYNKTTSQLWSIDNYTRWHVATTALPTGLSSLRLRFVFQSDEALEKDGIALDDIHIYDNLNPVYDGATTSTPVTNAVNGNNWVNFIRDGKIIASVQPKNQDLGSTMVKAFISSGSVRTSNEQYYHHRNLTIQPSDRTPADSVKVRFYFLDSETDSLILAGGCSSCSKPASAYELGVSKYSDPDLSFENGTISDNQQGEWSFIERKNLVIVPYDKGYYAEFSVADFSEFWLSNGGFDKQSPLPVKLMKFTAEKVNVEDVLLKWQVGSEDNIDRYEIELARTSEEMIAGSFQKIGEVMSPGNTTSTRNYDFTDNEPGKTGTRYYRLKIINLNGAFTYSPVRSVSFDDAVLWNVYPNPSKGMFYLMYQVNAGERMNARVYDSKGRMVKDLQEQGTGSPQKLSIDLGMTSSGIYLLRVDAGGKTYSFKLNKQ